MDHRASLKQIWSFAQIPLVWPRNIKLDYKGRSISYGVFFSDHPIDTEVLRVDMQQPIVLSVLETGVDRNVVKTVIERRLRETGKGDEKLDKMVHGRLLKYLKYALYLCACLSAFQPYFPSVAVCFYLNFMTSNTLNQFNIYFQIRLDPLINTTS